MRIKFYLFLVIPTLLIIVVFISVNYFVLYPSIENAMIDEKRNDIKQLTLLATDVIEEFITDYQQGEISLAEAQYSSKEKIRNLNFWGDSNNYFWIMDTYPSMVMHPYRKDLEGKDLSTFTDPEGKELFNDALELAFSQNEGYLEYLWENQPGEFNPKMSYVKIIDDWNWIIGASFLIKDVEKNIKENKINLAKTSFYLFGFILILTAFILFYGIRGERRRKNALDRLMLSEEKFRNLFHNSNDIIIISDFNGTILEVNNKILNKYHTNKEDLIGNKTFEFIPAEYHSIIINRINRLKNEDLPPIEIEFTLDKKKYYQVEINTSAFRYKDSMALFSIIREITERKQLEKQLMNAIITGEENERMRLAKDLHDGLGPFLSTIKFYFQWLSETSDMKKRDVIIEKGNKNIEEAIGVLKEIANNLNPHILTNFGLMEAIKEFITKFEGNQLCQIKFTPIANKRFSMQVETTLYRVLIELINNTLKYAKASVINIHFSLVESETLELEYADNGTGFDFEKVQQHTKGLGLVNIKNRIEAINGKLYINTSEGNGFKLNCTIQL